jgi:hypothetical protein
VGVDVTPNNPLHPAERRGSLCSPRRSAGERVIVRLGPAVALWHPSQAGSATGAGSPRRRTEPGVGSAALLRDVLLRMEAS